MSRARKRTPTPYRPAVGAAAVMDTHDEKDHTRSRWMSASPHASHCAVLLGYGCTCAERARRQKAILEQWITGPDSEARRAARAPDPTHRTEPAPGYVVGLPGSRPWTLSDAQGTLRSTCETRAEAVARSWELHDEDGEGRKIAETGCRSI